jgi:uncharacterized membrane protein YGL010W
MMGGRSWDDWIEEYAESHHHPMNRLTHTFGIPMIALSILLVPVGLFVNGVWWVAYSSSAIILKASRPSFLRTIASCSSASAGG